MISKDGRFEQKLQIIHSYAFLINIPVLSPVLSVGNSIGIHQTFSSSLAEGYQYRGFTGANWAVSLSGKTPILFIPYRAKMYAGGTLGGILLFNIYDYTMLHFIYPGIFIQAYLEYISPWIPFCSLTGFVNFNIHFRRDLEYSYSTGVGIALKFYPLTPRKAS